MNVMGLTPLYFPLTLYKLTYIKLSEALCELAPCFNNYWSKLWAYLFKKKKNRPDSRSGRSQGLKSSRRY